MSGNPWASVGHSARLWPKFFAPGRERELTQRRAKVRGAAIEPTRNAASEEES
jgi:hypothetical protein